MRIALVTEIPAPYRIPSFNALAQIEDVDLHVLLLAETDPRRQYRFEQEAMRFDWTVLRGRSLRRAGVWVVASRGTRRSLRRLAPDAVIVGGWSQPAFWEAAWYARRNQKPLLVWVESTARDTRSGWAPFEQLKRRLIGAAAGVIVPGAAAADYARALGVEPERIVVAPNAIDLDVFDRRVAELRLKRDRIRADLGLEGFVVLSVGRLEREKGPDVLVEAMGGVDGMAVLVGTGSLEKELRAVAPPGRVRFLGHLPPDELPALYVAADAFALPSRSETWGMVLNEAAAAGLPLVASDVAGASYDLVEPGVNGDRVPAGDAGALAEALRVLARDPALRQTAGTRSRELAARLTPDGWASAVSAHVRRIAS